MSAAAQMKIDVAPKAEDAAALKTQLTSAKLEIEAALAEAKAAADTIIERAEQLLGMPSEAGAIGDASIGILEACGFQDITGQRLKKALKTLDRVVAELENQDIGLVALAEDAEYAMWKEANFVHGPAQPDEALAQDSIDDLFAKS